VSLVKSRFTPPPTYETRTHREARLAAERKRQEAWDAEQERLAAKEEAEEQKLDDLQAGDPERYQALYRQCEDTLYQEFPSMMRFGKPDSSLHVGSIRSRMKHLLREQPAPEQASDPISFVKLVAVLTSAPMEPDDASPETVPPMAGEPAAEQQPEGVASDPPQAEDGGEAAQLSPTPGDPSVEPAAGTTPAAEPIHSVFIEISSASAEPTPEPANEESAALTTPQRPESKVLDDVLDWRYTGNLLHPTQKPVGALAPLIAAFTQPGELVLDPFCGSGSALLAARSLKRRYLGIEIDPDHCKTAQERMAG
jgi:DNA methylase